MMALEPGARLTVDRGGNNLWMARLVARTPRHDLTEIRQAKRSLDIQCHSHFTGGDDGATGFGGRMVFAPCAPLWCGDHGRRFTESGVIFELSRGLLASGISERFMRFNGQPDGEFSVRAAFSFAGSGQNLRTTY